MSALRRWLHRIDGKWFIAAVLGMQIVPIAQACPLPLMDVSMASADSTMIEACAEISRHACLVGCVQSDQAPNNDGASIAAHLATLLPVVAPVAIASLARADRPCRSDFHAGAPPPRLLFCRMLK
jgi:hypothetical protein